MSGNTWVLIFLTITEYIGLGMLTISLLIERKKSKKVREILREEQKEKRG